MFNTDLNAFTHITPKALYFEISLVYTICFISLYIIYSLKLNFSGKMHTFVYFKSE